MVEKSEVAITGLLKSLRDSGGKNWLPDSISDVASEALALIAQLREELDNQEDILDNLSWRNFGNIE